MLTIKELRSSTKKELAAELDKARQQRLATSIAVKTKHNKDSSQVGKQKLYIARILTALNEFHDEEVAKAETKKPEKSSDEAK